MGKGNSKEFYSLMKPFNGIQESIVILDWEGKIVGWNQEAGNIFGYSTDEIKGKKIYELYPIRKDQLRTILDKLKNGNIVKEGLVTHNNGEVKYIFIVATNTDELPEDRISATIFSCNFPERFTFQRSLRLASIVSSSDDAIISLTLNGIITSWNKAAEHIYGYKEAQALGQHIKIIVPDERLDELLEIMGNLKKDIRTDHLETKRKTKDGNKLDVSVTFSPIKDRWGNVIEASAIERDITKRKHLELKERNLEQRILEVSEKEQQRLASYLHDNIGQLLTGIRLSSLNISQKLEKRDPESAREVREISDLIQRVDQEVRDLSRGLVQSEISSTNLQNALEQLKIKTEKLYNVDCNLKYDSNVDIEDADTIQHIYRIAQEAVRNAVIHGNADVVEILLEQSEDGHSIIISDNGHGFSQSIKESTDVGIGITTMKYRAQLLGGRLKIDETGNGVRVTCIIPKN